MAGNRTGAGRHRTGAVRRGIALAAGILWAAGGAAAAWGWLVARLPWPAAALVGSVILIAPAGAAGVVWFGRLRRRGIAAGAALLVLGAFWGVFLFGLYVAEAMAYSAAVVQQAKQAAMPADQAEAIINYATRTPYRVFDDRVLGETGRRGLLGFLMLNGGTVKLGLLQVAFTLALAVSLPGRPCCPACGRWCRKHRLLGEMDGGYAEPLAAAIEKGDWAVVAALKKVPPPEQDPGKVRVTAITCAGCRKTFADVTYEAFVEGTTRTDRLAEKVEVSPEVVEALARKS